MGAKITCIHNSLYLHLHFKNCSDTFCKYNTLLEVPHATQLLTNNFVKGQFSTPRKYAKKHTLCSPYLFWCVYAFGTKFVLMIGKNFYKIRYDSHTKS